MHLARRLPLVDRAIRRSVSRPSRVQEKKIVYIQRAHPKSVASRFTSNSNGFLKNSSTDPFLQASASNSDDRSRRSVYSRAESVPPRPSSFELSICPENIGRTGYFCRTIRPRTKQNGSSEFHFSNIREKRRLSD